MKPTAKEMIESLRGSTINFPRSNNGDGRPWGNCTNFIKILEHFGVDHQVTHGAATIYVEVISTSSPKPSFSLGVSPTIRTGILPRDTRKNR